MQSFVLVGLGGAVGAMTRYGVNLAVPVVPSGFPVATFIINVIGSLLMGLVAGVLSRFAPEAIEGWRLLLGVGVLGGFTTFSAFSLETLNLIQRGSYGVAFSYAIMSTVLALAAVAAGFYVARAGA